MNSLQLSLISNAIFSSVSGLLLLFIPKQVASYFQISNYNPFWMIGVGLLLFAITVFIEARQQRERQVKFIVIQDLLWVLGSIVILIFQPFGISSGGNLVIGLVALMVLIFAVWQARSLKTVAKV